MDGELLLLLAGAAIAVLLLILGLRSWWHGGHAPHPHEHGGEVYPPVAAHHRSHEAEGADDPPLS